MFILLYNSHDYVTTANKANFSRFPTSFTTFPTCVNANVVASIRREHPMRHAKTACPTKAEKRHTAHIERDRRG